jgi:hypothetical protein
VVGPPHPLAPEARADISADALTHRELENRIGAIMKEVLSLITLGIGALFFAVFFAALKPDVVNVATGPSKPGYCDTKASPTLTC